MKMTPLKISEIIISAGLILAAGTAIYMWFKPHRNIQNEKVFAIVNASDLTKEFTTNAVRANSKYLNSDGNSKVLVVTSRVSHISTNQTGENVLF
ncbi:MAG TPA: hypothetical protein DIC22_11505 [Chitinophagaceae bacterium]|jgi:hypothetical protein|nr:hypothetical protein [Chitinophagaceae bacterium]